jgi:hypothetical protein
MTEQSIERFKEYAHLQVRHRVEVYHRSRRQLELKAHCFVREEQTQTVP